MKYTALVIIHYKNDLIIEHFSIEHENVYEFTETLKFHFEERYDPERSAHYLRQQNFFVDFKEEMELKEYIIL